MVIRAGGIMRVYLSNRRGFPDPGGTSGSRCGESSGRENGASEFHVCIPRAEYCTRLLRLLPLRMPPGPEGKEPSGVAAAGDAERVVPVAVEEVT